MRDDGREDGWTYVLAAPLALDEDIEPVPLWCRDQANCWWLVIDDERIRRLTDVESARAAIHVPFESRTAADVDAIMGDLLPAPAEARPRLRLVKGGR